MSTLDIGNLAPLPPPHRPATTCDLHPGETVTGFCASCLRERLAGLDSAAAAPGRRSTSALKSFFFFKPSAPSAAAGAGAGAGAGPQPPSSSSSAFLRPELRRCKSFSCGRGGGDGARAAASAVAAAFEPQRRSCDVRGRSTLWSLFNQDDRDRFRSGAAAAPEPFLPASASSAAAAAIGGEMEAERPSLGFPPPCVCVLEAREEEDEERDAADEITPADPVLVVGTSGEVGGGEANAVAAEEEEAKPMKEHMDIESNPSKRTSPKDLKEIAGSFWLAASVFSKKWQQWRRKQKQKLKKQGGGGVAGGSTSKAAAAAMPPPERPPRSSLRGRRRRFLDTQSEVAADASASARRSCDTDPRFSLDAGRVSFDDPRFSWDEPRASWDGHLLGGGGGGAGARSLFTRLPPIVSVVEDAPAPAVQRSDGQIPVEEDSAAPGGSAQTRDYYESASRKRRSFERSMSLRKAAPPGEADDPKPAATNAKVSPAGGAEFYHLHHASSILDRDLRDLSSNSLRDDVSESFESAFRDSRKGARAKKSNRWSKAWSIWGFIHRRGSRAEEAAANGVGVERSFSESWPELRMRGYDGKILRSNSSLSARSSFSSFSVGGGGGYGSTRINGNGNGNGNGMKKKKGREEFALERNRSARYSPSRVENGMLRFFYMTPSRSGTSSSTSRRRNGMVGNGRHVGSNSFARSALRLY